jgi:hypothetical protein
LVGPIHTGQGGGRGLVVGLAGGAARLSSFVVFNGTVVDETGAIRWVGLAGFAVLAGLAGWRWAGEKVAR